MKLFNVLVSYRFGEYQNAHGEALALFKELGDGEAIMEQTQVWGVAGVTSVLNNKKAVSAVRERYHRDPESIHYAIKWIPVDNWCATEIAAMLKIIEKIGMEIRPDEKWAMQLERHRFEKHHTEELIGMLTAPLKGAVDLSHPDKVVRVDIVGDQTGISLLDPQDVFSLTHLQDSEMEAA